jgi:OmpA-OmpF porin, OOP family
VKDIKLIVLFIFCSLLSLAQIDSNLIKNSSPKTLKNMGKNAMQQNDPEMAIACFESYLKKAPNDPKVMNLLAMNYMEIRDYDRAQHQFLKAYTSDKEKQKEALYYHAQMQKSNGFYDSAKFNFQKFKKEYKGTDKLMKKQATKEIVFCDSVQNLVKTEKKIVIEHLDSTINKVNTEAAPASLDENTIVFTSLRTDKKEFILEDDTARPILRKLYLAKRENDEWKFKGEYGTNLNTGNNNTGNACFSTDRKRMYFTRCKPNTKGEMICAIYVTEKNGEEWTEPVKLPKSINNPKYTSTMPAVTIDPAKGNDVIYFVSNNKEGRGGFDIWYTIYDKKKGIYKDPKNAGNKVNTPQNEITPYFDNETRQLYFSSDGLGGLGGYDVFKATGDGRKWLNTENIGQPINTGADDIYYTIAVNREEGFLVSNRKGSNALKNSTCCDDIYRYKYTEYIKINLSGNINEFVDNTKVIKEATVEVYIKDKKNGEKFLVKTVNSDENGNYKTTLEAGQDYALVVKKKDFLGNGAEVSTKTITTSQDLLKNVSLAKEPKEPIRIPNIQYEFDKSVILESSKIAIDTTVFALMDANPEIIVEIQSHTDSKGSEQYNTKLSQSRAESVVNYLVGKGIKLERLKAMGYGESKPVAPNDKPDGSDNPDGRALNRRTDFKIIGKLDVEVINDGNAE